MTGDVKLLVKNMVCPRCILSVQQILDGQSIVYDKVELGEIFLPQPINETQTKAFREALGTIGFELIETRVNKIVADMKLAVSDYLNTIADRKQNLSALITDRLAYDYSYLSDLFSGIEGKSVEQYFIELRIERVKELIVYDQLTFTEIAFRTGFSSVHHLSSQFRKNTGLTPSHFKKVGTLKRRSIDGI
ncbi:helix-turn-helix domain-containing protein [Flavobacterium sp.]|uniref:helix-turn-helix domain-containing protein n=1 Tax=Flavobacterium sp. TaxID=239 RepID=UPI0039E47AA0